MVHIINLIIDCLKSFILQQKSRHGWMHIGALLSKRFGRATSNFSTTRWPALLLCRQPIQTQSRHLKAATTRIKFALLVLSSSPFVNFHHQPPEIFFKESIIPEIPVAYLLLHDNTNGDAGRAKTVLEQMMAKFGTSASFYLPINSKKTPNIAAEAEFWIPYINLESSIQAAGSSVSDMTRTTSMASLASVDMGHRRNPSAGKPIKYLSHAYLALSLVFFLFQISNGMHLEARWRIFLQRQLQWKCMGL